MFINSLDIITAYSRTNQFPWLLLLGPPISGLFQQIPDGDLFLIGESLDELRLLVKLVYNSILLKTNLVLSLLPMILLQGGHTLGEGIMLHVKAAGQCRVPRLYSVPIAFLLTHKVLISIEAYQHL